MSTVTVDPEVAGLVSNVNSSADDVADVPDGVVTVMLIVPVEPAGAVAVIDVDESTVYDVALVEPNLTAVAPVKPVPVMVMGLVPPAVPPTIGLTPVTVGGEAVCAKATATDDESPPVACVHVVWWSEESDAM